MTEPLAAPQDVALRRQDIDLLRKEMNAGFASLRRRAHPAISAADGLSARILRSSR